MNERIFLLLYWNSLILACFFLADNCLWIILFGTVVTSLRQARSLAFDTALLWHLLLLAFLREIA